MAGAAVAFTYNSNHGLAARLEKRFSKISKCKAYKVDISNEDEIKSTVNSVLKDFGRIDVLVNNAGIWKEGKITKMKLSEWEETIKTNLTSTFLFTQIVSRFMKLKDMARLLIYHQLQVSVVKQITRTMPLLKAE